MAAKNLQDKVQLNNGVHMPWFGLGVYKVANGEEVKSAVKAAIKHGYRSIDTAAFYQNEEGVGQAIREAVEENGLKREDIFVTSKVWNTDLGYDSTLAAYEASLRRLGMEYLDLYLIHWPITGKYQESWKALETLYQEGRVRTIGVSNFHIHHLENILKDAAVIPAVNQIEYHPRLAQIELHEYCKGKGIQLEAWSPLMRGALMDHPVLVEIAASKGKTVPQVILRWDLENEVITIPKSVKEERIIENADIFDFELTEEEMKLIGKLNKNERIGSNPDDV